MLTAEFIYVKKIEQELRNNNGDEKNKKKEKLFLDRYHNPNYNTSFIFKFITRRICMKSVVPEKVSQEELKIPVSEIESWLSGPKVELPEFEPAYTETRDGKKLVIRALRKDEAPALLKFLKNFLEVERDFYDIVGVRVYAEVLGWLRNRLKDSYHLVGSIDGELAGFANGRKRDDKVHISLHSMAFKRGGGVGAAMYYAKAQYAFEVLGAQEWWSTFESYNGWKRYGLGAAQPSYPWPEYQHELGGAAVYYIRRDYWDSTVKGYNKQLVHGDLIRPVPADLLKKAENLIIPDKPDV